MISQKRTITIKIIPLLLLGVLFVFASSTFLRTRYGFVQAVFGYLVLMVLTVLMKQRWLVTGTTLWALLAMAAAGMYLVVGATSQQTITYLAGVVYLYFWFHAFIYLAENYERQTITRFCVIQVLLLIVCVVATLRVLAISPLAARAIYGVADDVSQSDTARYMRMGCGGFGFIYGCMFLSVAILCAARSKSAPKALRIAAVPVYLLVVFLIVQSQFTTAFLLILIGFLLTMLINAKHYVLSIVLTVLLGVVVLITFQDILSLLSKLASDMGADFISNKLSMLLTSAGNDDVESLARTKKYMESVQGFLSNPLIGSGTTGGHSQLLDTFSMIGLFAVPYVGMLISMFRRMRRYIEGKYVTILEILTFLLATFNPFVDSTVISLTVFLVPCILFLFAPKAAAQQAPEKTPEKASADPPKELVS